MSDDEDEITLCDCCRAPIAEGLQFCGRCGRARREALKWAAQKVRRSGHYALAEEIEKGPTNASK